MANKPYVVVEWNDTEIEAKGWMYAYNFVGHYCGGGTRMHPTVTKEEVIRLATTMGYKYKACESQTTGGCKAGIAYDYKAPDALDVLRRFLTATAPYINAGVSIGGDLGVDYSDVLNILDDLGIGIPQTKAMKEDPDIHQGIVNHDRAEKELTYDGFKMYDMITGYGVAAAADEAWKLKGGKEGASVVIQGFGCVGASYTSTSYFTPYLTEVIGVSPESSGLVSIIRNYLLLLLAPVGGIIADKLFKSTCKWLTTALAVLAALFGIVMILPESISPMAASLYTLIPGAFAMMMYGVIFSTVSEAGIPRKMTGTVIGIASIIGYLPDSVYVVIFGNWMDKHGAQGYNYIFTFMIVTCLIGAVLSVFIYRAGKKAKAEN